MNRMGDYGIAKGGTDFSHLKYPWRSQNQVVYINLTATEGLFSLLILDENALEEWNDKIPFNPYYQANNITEMYIEIKLEPPNRNRLTTIIIADEDLSIEGIITTHYLDYNTNTGIIFLVIVVFSTSYYLYQKYKTHS
ncbi:hypothetical protein LCGC14_0505480 [marine sediment metagenome]|uniref:Uncharacterized protein n=1 Tax=marine sediment metagenome TaxID=412755 RepID=A0A0F9VB62_9ZZZZ|nr:hypothetical protein [archaeon]